MRTTLLWTVLALLVLWAPVVRHASRAEVAPGRLALVSAHAERAADNKIIVWTSVENPGVAGRTIHQLIVAIDSAGHQIAALPVPSAETHQPTLLHPAFSLTPVDFVGPVEVIVTLSEEDVNGTTLSRETRTLSVL